MRSEELASFSLFAGLSQKQLDLLAPMFWRANFSEGERVFSQGDPANHIYVLESGEVALRFFPYDGGSLDIESIRPGGVFGWSAALGREVYTSAAICVTDVTLIATPGNDLRRLMREHKALGVLLLDRMSQVVAHRLNSFRSQLSRLLRVEDEAEKL